MLHQAAAVAEEDAARLTLRRTTDVGLRCHGVTFKLAIKLYHDACLMSVSRRAVSRRAVSRRAVSRRAVSRRAVSRRAVG
jgi:hypothetical protein